MGKEKDYLSFELPAEESIEDLLGRMTLEEKIDQLKARMFTFRRMFSKLFEELFKGLLEDQRERLEELIVRMVFEKRDIRDSLSANYWRKHWKEGIQPGPSS